MAQVDFGRALLLTRGTLSGGVTSQGTFAGEATISSGGNAFGGIFRLSDFGEIQGSFAGRFYGPQSQEIGASFSVGSTDRVAVGAIIGRGADATAVNSAVRPPSVTEFFDTNAALLKTQITGSSGYNDTSGEFSATNAAAAPLVVNYDADDGAYTVFAPDRTQHFLGARIGGSTTEEFLDGTAQQDLAGFDYPILVNLKYVAARRWTVATSIGGNATQYRIEDAVFGVATANSAVPRSGTGAYSVGITGIATDADFPNLTKISGFGFLTANFATASLSLNGQLRFKEDYMIAGRRPGTRQGNFSATATISSSANSFTGPISFDGIGNYSGTLDGRFFGPAAEEVGGSFSATDGNGGNAIGTLVGGLDPAAAAVVSPLAELSAPTDLAFAYGSGVPSFDQVIGVAFDPATQSYSLTFKDIHLQGAPVNTLTLGPTTRDNAASTTSVDAFQGAIADRPFNATVLKPVATNPTIALTYTSLALIAAPRPPSPQTEDPRDGRYYIAFGVQTPRLQMPIGGTATYNGIAIGAGKVTTNAFGGPSPSVTTFYELNGTIALTADFVNGTLSSTLNLTGRDSASAAMRTFDTVHSDADITSNTFQSHFNGNSIAGSFFGPHAEEIGGAFDYSQSDSANTLVDLKGAFAGKR